MNGRVLLGAVMFVGGAAVWFFSRDAATRARSRRVVAGTLPRLGVAVGSLGLSIMASAQRGVSWSVSSICFSLIAIILLVLVARDSLRR